MPSPRRFPFRVTLLTLLVGLLFLTVASIVGVGAITAQRSVEDLEARYFKATSAGVGGEVRPFLEPAVFALADVRAQALDGRVRLHDAHDLGRYLASRLRNLRTAAWLSYSDDATGRFTGAWRREDGGIVLNHSDPAEDGGRPEEHEIREDGTLVPFSRPLKGGYDPRQGAWYRRAVAAEGIVWTEPFQFNEGKPGITSALALRDGPGRPARGVLTADFFLGDLSRFLDALAGDGSTAIRLITREGNVVAESAAARGDAGPMVRALASAPEPPARLAAATSISWRFSHGDAAHVAGARVVRTAGGGEWVVVVAVPEEQFLSGVEGNRRVAIGAASAFLAISLALGWWLASRVARPLRRIADDLERVARFELSGSGPPATRVKEIAVVADAAERMKASLRSFGRYVPTELVRDLLERGEEARLGGRHREVTLLFADAEGFTTIAESMEPEPLAEHLGEFLEAISDAVRAHGGTIDKFMGDGVLAFFNAPRDVPGHALAACRAALACQARLAELATRWAAEGKPILRARIGLHTGDVVVGNLGTPERFGYTVIGDAVNLASRIEGLNRRYGTRILVSEATRSAAGDELTWRTVDRVSVAGRAGVTLLFEPLGETAQADAGTLRARDVYEEALARFVARDFAGALDGFRAAAAARAGDRAAPRLAARAEACLRTPPPADWDGAEVLQEK